MRRCSWTTALTFSSAHWLTLCPRIDWPFSACDGDVLQGVAWCGKLLDEWVFGMPAQIHRLVQYALCVCVIVLMSNAGMCVCRNTMLYLCCYRMELWPLSRQHSCVAIGLGVRGSSRRLRDNKLPPPPLPHTGRHNAPPRQHPLPWDRRTETGLVWVSHGNRCIQRTCIRLQESFKSFKSNCWLFPYLLLNVLNHDHSWLSWESNVRLTMSSCWM